MSNCINRLGNGYLELRSSVVDVGTTWTINLVKSAPGPAEEEEQQQPEGGASDITATDKHEPVFKRAKTGKADLKTLFPGGVVVVDDDTMARLAVKGALSKRYGVAVQAHESAHAFLDSMFRPDHNGAAGAGAAVDATGQPRCLILMDHMMPVMDGEEVLGHIPAGHPHFIAMMSGTHFTAEHREIIRKKGVSAFFEKPLEWEQFDSDLTQAAGEFLSGDRV